jgi:hypothetical protein
VSGLLSALTHVDRQVIIETLGTRFANNSVALPASSNRGGIILAVDEDHYNIVSFELGMHSVTAHLIAKAGPVDWWITTVYGPHCDNGKL